MKAIQARHVEHENYKGWHIDYFDTGAGYGKNFAVIQGPYSPISVKVREWTTAECREAARNYITIERIRHGLRS